MTAIAPNWFVLLQGAADDLKTQLLQTERQARSQRPPIVADSLQGVWQLQAVLNKSGRLRRWPRAIPASIQYDFSAAVGQITNQVGLGNLRLRFQGPCQFEADRNLLWFDFERWQVAWGDRILVQGQLGRADQAALSDRLQQRPRPKLPFFHYFSVTPTAIAARGRGGGVAVWLKSDCDR